MGLFLVLMAFLYPLGMPLVTLGSFIFIAILSAARPTRQFFQGLLVVPALLLFLAPGIVTTGAGTFALPWWLHMLVGHSGVKYYVWHYGLVCVGLLIAFSVGALAYQTMVLRRVRHK
jgi:hypothetical protein